MIWILAQCSQQLVCATAVQMRGRDDAIDAPMRYELWAQAGDREVRVGNYNKFADAQDAFSDIVEAARNGAGFVDLRTL